MSGQFVYSAACFDTKEFARPFAAFCPGFGVVGSRAALRVNGQVTIASGRASRTGVIRLAAEVRAPCRGLFGATCTDFARFVAGAPGQRDNHEYTMRCYDQSSSECICHLEDVFEPDDEGLSVDPSTGSMGDDFVYGATGSSFAFTGRPVATYTSSNFTVEPAFRWGLVRLP